MQNNPSLGLFLNRGCDLKLAGEGEAEDPVRCSLFCAAISKKRSLTHADVWSRVCRQLRPNAGRPFAVAPPPSKRCEPAQVLSGIEFRNYLHAVGVWGSEFGPGSWQQGRARDGRGEGRFKKADTQTPCLLLCVCRVSFIVGRGCACLYIGVL